jgi:hypothetical protein
LVADTDPHAGLPHHDPEADERWHDAARAIDAGRQSPG